MYFRRTALVFGLSLLAALPATAQIAKPGKNPSDPAKALATPSIGAAPGTGKAAGTEKAGKAAKNIVHIALLDASTLTPAVTAGGHAEMAIRADRTTVKAGLVRFDVINWSAANTHELLVVPAPDGGAHLVAAGGRVDETVAKPLADTGDMKPSANKTIQLQLAAGNYLLICNLPGHFDNGMQVALTVTP